MLADSAEVHSGSMCVHRISMIAAERRQEVLSKLIQRLKEFSTWKKIERALIIDFHPNLSDSSASNASDSKFE